MSGQIKPRTLVMQVVSIIAFALVSAAFPGYAWIIFLLYFVILMLIMTRTTRRGFKKVSEIRGSPLFKEENAMVIGSKDELLIKEMKEQFRPMMVLFILPLFVILIAPIYWNYIAPLIENFLASIVESQFITDFIRFLAFYAFIISVMYIPRFFIMRKVVQKKQLYIPRTFYIYKAGIYADGKLIEPSREACYEVNLSRKFVEINSPKLPFVVRLYTLEVSRLADKLREIGLYEC